MFGTLTEKILKNHIKEKSHRLISGEKVDIYPDDTLIQDASGVLVWLEVEAFNIKKTYTRPITFIDHNTLQVGSENSDDHEFLQSVTSKYGTILSKAGNGICHSVYLENYAEPGNLLLGGDSHTPNAGGMGMIGIGVGGLNISKCISGKSYKLKLPEVIGVELTGRFNDWVTAKDLIITIIKDLGTKNKYKSIEYFGKGISELTVDERSTITNMGAELGVTFSLFPSDEVTKSYLAAVGRSECYKELHSEPDAKYANLYKYDLSSIEPMLVYPPEPNKRGLGKPNPIKGALGTKVNQVCIGSCTNSSYHDLRIVAECLKGKKVNHNLELIITPGSRAIRDKLLNDGIYQILSLAGARITEEVCGPCVGQGYSPPSNGVRVATFNRNFIGRSGTSDAEVYLCSPETAVAAAITGKITDPRDLFSGIEYKRYPLDRLNVDTSLIIDNKSKINKKIKLVKSINISELPPFPKFEKFIKCKVILKLPSRVTTDDIAPAGQWLKKRSNLEEYSKGTFNSVDKNFYTRAKENISKGFHNVIVAGDGYGEGSAKEHAALCPMYLGVRIVFAKSFQRIHRSNLLNFGLIPIEVTESEFEFFNQDDQIEVDFTIKDNDTLLIVVKNLTTCENLSVINTFDKDELILIKSGGVFNE